MFNEFVTIFLMLFYLIYFSSEVKVRGGKKNSAKVVVKKETEQPTNKKPKIG